MDTVPTDTDRPPSLNPGPLQATATRTAPTTVSTTAPCGFAAGPTAPTRSGFTILTGMAAIDRLLGPTLCMKRESFMKRIPKSSPTDESDMQTDDQARRDGGKTTEDKSVSKEQLK